MVRISSVPGLTQVAHGATPDPVKEIVDVPLEDLPLLDEGHPFTGNLPFAGACFAGAFLDLLQRNFEATGWRQT